MYIDELDTPTPVVDLEVALRNLETMQSYCNAYNIALRPHIKTHKLPFFAIKQLALGAVGVACQKISEATVMAQAGVGDILLTYNVVGQRKLEPLARLARLADLSVGVDNETAIMTAESAAQRAGKVIGVLLEFDSGLARTGVSSAESIIKLARRVEASPHLEYRGIMCYPSGAEATLWLDDALPKLRAEGLTPRIISGGGTPQARETHLSPHVNELRVGTYIYNDKMMVSAGAATLADCALSVKVTVVSRAAPTRAVIDAGSKTLSSDQLPAEGGYGLVREYPGAVLERLYEEHGVLDLSGCADKPEVGDVLTIIPNHACVVTNLHDEIVLHKSGTVVSHMPVAARGKTV